MSPALQATLQGIRVPARVEVFTLPELVLELARQEAARRVHEEAPNYSTRIAEYWLAQDPPADLRAMRPRPPWCMVFARWLFAVAAELLRVPDPLRAMRRGYGALVQELVDVGSEHGWVLRAHEAQPGDLVAYAWHGPGHYNHVGVLEMPPDYGPTFRTIEGNTPPADTGDQRGGGAAAADGVWAKKRRMTVANPVFIRPGADRSLRSNPGPR